MDNRKVAIASVGAEGELLIDIKSVCVHTFANSRCGNHLAAVRIHYRHHLVAAAGKQPAVFLIHGQTTKFFARRQRPAFYHNRFLNIDTGQFALVLDVHIDHALAIRGAKLWFAVERNIADHLVIRGVDDRGILAATVKRKDALDGS